MSRLTHAQLLALQRRKVGQCDRLAKELDRVRGEIHCPENEHLIDLRIKPSESPSALIRRLSREYDRIDAKRQRCLLELGWLNTKLQTTAATVRHGGPK